jgi:hypothetical protein
MPSSVGVLGRRGARRPTGTFAEALLAVPPSGRTRRPPHPDPRTGRPQVDPGRGRSTPSSGIGRLKLIVPPRLRSFIIPNERYWLPGGFRLGSRAGRPAGSDGSQATELRGGALSGPSSCQSQRVLNEESHVRVTQEEASVACSSSSAWKVQRMGSSRKGGVLVNLHHFTPSAAIRKIRFCM